MHRQLASIRAFRRSVLAIAALALMPAAALSQGNRDLDRIAWHRGPGEGTLGTTAKVGVPDGCAFADDKGVKQFMEVTENPTSGREEGVLLCYDAQGHVWFVVFSYHKSGYVRDTEKSSLDPAATLEAIKRGTAVANQRRRKRGWSELTIVGWQRPPYYDQNTNNLTWSIRARDADGSESVNHSVRLLGRRGVMHADLVAEPAQLPTAVATFDAILRNFSYLSGEKYAEWRQGDKVAAYGLTALIVGGAAAKLGLFAKLKKFIFLAIAALVSLLAKLFKGSRSPKTDDKGSAPPTPAQNVPPADGEVFVCRVGTSSGPKDYVTPLSPDLQQQHGLPAHAIIGAITRRLGLGEPITPDAFAVNAAFVDHLHRFLEEQAPKDPKLVAEAQRVVDGWVYIVDQRTHTPRGEVPPEDIIAGIQVSNGMLVAGSYKPNEKHLLLSDAGFFKLGRKLHPLFLRTLTESLETVST